MFGCWFSLHSNVSVCMCKHWISNCMQMQCTLHKCYIMISGRIFLFFSTFCSVVRLFGTQFYLAWMMDTVFNAIYRFTHISCAHNTSRKPYKLFRLMPLLLLLAFYYFNQNRIASSKQNNLNFISFFSYFSNYKTVKYATIWVLKKDHKCVKILYSVVLTTTMMMKALIHFAVYFHPHWWIFDARNKKQTFITPLIRVPGCGSVWCSTSLYF